MRLFKAPAAAALIPPQRLNRIHNWQLLLAAWGLLLCGLMIIVIKTDNAALTGKLSLQSFAIGGSYTYIFWMAAVIVLAAGIQLVLIRRQQDTFLFPLVLMLASVGLCEIARLKPALLARQFEWLFLSMLALLVVMRLWPKIHEWLEYPYILGVVCIVLLGLPLIFGTEIGGSRNWIVFGPVSLQPSEFGKLLIIFFLAAYLSDHRRVLTLPAHRFLLLQLPPLRFIAPLITIWGFSVLMFVVERDLGSALLFFGMAVLMTYMATGSKSYVFLALSFFGLAAVISYMAFAHVRVRFNIWLDPWQDPNGMAYQVVQSLFSFGTGGVWGTGFGFGHPGFIPEVHTDFIYAAIAEELGLIGALMVLLCYVLFFWRGIRLALSLRSEPDALLAAGGATLMLLQAFIIIAGVTKFLPLTGITLPFVSYGGSSLLSGFILLGILISLSGESHANTTKEPFDG